MSYGWPKKVYKNQFHFFSILEQQEGLISILVLSHYNVSPSGFSIFPGVNRIECPTHVEERTKNCLVKLNHKSYCLFPSKVNSPYFYDPISALIDGVCKNQFQPWHDFIPHLSLNIKQHVRMVTIFIHFSYEPSLTCYIINYKESSIDLFSKWLHWIYDFT